MLQQNYGLRENAAGTHQQLLHREEEVGQLSEEVRERSALGRPAPGARA